LTLGRIKDGAGRESSRLGAALAVEVDRDFGEWRVNAVTLLRSELSPADARHSVLAECCFVAGRPRLVKSTRKPGLQTSA